MDKNKFIDDVVTDINESKDTESKAKVASGDLGYDLNIDNAVSTDIPILDYYLGGGVFPGRIVEIFGEESTGKSTLAYHIMSRVELDWDGVNILVESESALDKDRAHVIGADPRNIITTTPKHCEDAFQTIGRYITKIRENEEKMKKKGDEQFPVGITWDTIAAAPTKTEVEHAEGKGDKWGGGQSEKPRLIREWLRSVTKILPDSKAFIVLVNQVYEDISAYGKKLVSPGGRGIRHHCSARMFIQRGQAIYEEQKGGGKREVGFEVKVKMIKNKQAPTDGLDFKVDLYYATGYDPLSSLSHYVKDHELVEVTGNGWITAHVGGDEIKAHGPQKFSKKIKENERLRKALEFKCIKHIAQVSPVIRDRYYDYLCELAEEIGEEPPLHKKWDVYAREFKLHMTKKYKSFMTMDEALDFVLQFEDEIEEKDFSLEERNEFLEKNFNSAEE